MANTCATWPNTSMVNCYHFNQEVSTMKRPQVSTFCFTTTMEAVAERGRGRGRVRMRGGGRVRGRGRAGRGVHGQRRQQLSNEIRATLVDHVINHGLTMREAGQRVQPNLSCFTVACVIRTFRLEYRYVTKMSFTLCSTPHVIVYQLGDTCLLHEWLMSYTNCTNFL